MAPIRTFKLLVGLALVAHCGARSPAQQQTATGPTTAPAKTGTAQVSGVVLDSLHMRYLVGAEVFIEGAKKSRHGYSWAFQDGGPAAGLLSGRRVPSCARYAQHITGDQAVPCRTRQRELRRIVCAVGGNDHPQRVSGTNARPRSFGGDRARQRSGDTAAGRRRGGLDLVDGHRGGQRDRYHANSPPRARHHGCNGRIPSLWTAELNAGDVAGA